MDLSALPIRSTADTYLQDLQRFLPKYVSRTPAMTKSFVCIVVYVLLFHYVISGYIGLNVDFKEKEKKDIDRLLYFTILMLTAIAVGSFTFQLFFYNDNIKLNGNWITMKKLGMTFFHPVDA
tara:strand:- start:2491 stop:2856 length:366 start_codon:yes stop_codon:yes gene_type:complete